jgi:hypothetical protein
MFKTFYSMAVLNPIDFPEDIEIQYHGLDPQTERPTGEVVVCSTHRSWEWIRNYWPISNRSYLDECAGYLQQGVRANLARGEHSVEVESTSSASA